MPVKILVAEDWQHKSDQLRKHIDDVCNELRLDGQVELVTSYRSGLKKCIEWRPDLAILDMAMPTYDIIVNEPGGRPRHFAGRDILQELQRRKIVVRTVIFTGFDVIGEGVEQCTRGELADSLARLFPDSFVGMVYYTTADSGWKDEITAMIESELGGRV